MSETTLTAALADLASRELAADVRPPDPREDSVDGVAPGAVVEPRTREAVGAVLKWASEHRLRVLVTGAGTKRTWGRAAERADVVLGMRRMHRVLEHRAGDLTVSVEAGAPLREVNRTLAARGQRLPLDPPFADRATIGGLLATNDSGPERHRFGTPRDLVIGIELATADGRLAKAGGQVVKNVAGYDLSRLASGSFGSLAVITAATFKLSPVAPASATLRLGGLDPGDLPRVVELVAESSLEPVAFELHARAGSAAGERASCLLRFASLPPVVDAQVGEARSRLAAVRHDTDVVTGEAERQLWTRHSSAVWDSAGTIVRMSWLPADAGAVLELVNRLGATHETELVGRLGAGAGLLRLSGDDAAHASAVEGLRRSAVIGHVVLVRASAALKSTVDVWGPLPGAALYRAVKRALDPHDVLGAGRGPG